MQSCGGFFCALRRKLDGAQRIFRQPPVTEKYYVEFFFGGGEQCVQRGGQIRLPAAADAQAFDGGYIRLGHGGQRGHGRL